LSDVDNARPGNPAHALVGAVALRQRAMTIVRAVRSRMRGRSVLLFALMPALSVVNAGVGLVLPALLGPADFGQYSIAVTLFQYGLIFDFGVSQLIDRRVPVMASVGSAELPGFVGKALWLRLYIAVAVMAFGALLLFGLDSGGALPFTLPAGLLSLGGRPAVHAWPGADGHLSRNFTAT